MSLAGNVAALATRVATEIKSVRSWATATFATSSALTSGLAGKVDTSDGRLSDTRAPNDASVTNAKVNSSAGISADKLADGTTYKVMTATERTKLSGIEAGAAAKSVKPYAPVALTDGATPALNASLGTHFKLSASGNRTIGIPSSPTDGQVIVIQHLASGGARTLALNTGTGGFAFGTDITALTATASGKTDLIQAMYDTTANKWWVIGYVKGF